MSEEPDLQFSIEELQSEDFVAANEMRLQSYLDTYVNEVAGITRDWMIARNEQQRKPEIVEHRRKLMQDTLSAQWVAKDSQGKIIGVVGPYVSESGIQLVGSLYVDKKYHGKGVGSALIQKAINWFNPSKPIELGVVSYNERAKAFYRKWGFEEIPNFEHLFADKIPEVKMIRKAQI